MFVTNRRGRRPRGFATHDVSVLLYRELDEDDVPDALVVRPDGGDPDRHAFIEPRDFMPVSEYEELIWESRGAWRKVP